MFSIEERDIEDISIATNYLISDFIFLSTGCRVDISLHDEH